MDTKVDSLTVLRVIYNAFQEKKTLKTNLNYIDIQKNTPEISLEDIRPLVEYLSGHGYVTFQDHRVSQKICITSKGIDFYLENFQ